MSKKHASCLYKIVFLLLFFSPAIAQQQPDAVYQYAVPVEGRTAYLWIPPACSHVRGIILCLENALERNWMEAAAVRKAAEEEGLAMIWLADGKPTRITWEIKPEADSVLNKMFVDLSAVSGYPEIANAPLIVTGHSWNGRMAWTYPNRHPERVIAAIPIRTYPMPDSLSFKGIPLCYIVGQTTELPEYSDGRPGDRDFFWPIVRQTALALRSANEDNLIGVVTYPGGCHMDWSDDQSAFLALFIHKACHYRLPTKSTGNGTVTLNNIRRCDGWLTDAGGMESDQFPPAPYKSYKGDPKKAYWFFDKELAMAAVAFNGDRKTRSKQMISFVSNGDTLPVNRNGYVALPFTPAADGWSFEVAGGFLKAVPAGLINAGTSLGHANGSFTFRVVMGPAIQTGPHQFRVQFDRQAPRNIMIMATQQGDERYRRALQPAVINIPAKLLKGQPQSIVFPAIENQKATTGSIELKAQSSSGLAVNYYIVSGPATMDGHTLRFTKVPVKSKWPVKIKVVAYQWGRMIEPLWQTAEPVTREFYLIQ
ncbi:MAG TPA: hypothetical protein VGM41_17385 [Chitinophagaceae bacterium]|jgi:hypothetical protein